MSVTFSRRQLLATGSLALIASPHVAKAQAKELNLYSSRHYDTDEALYTGFTKLTGVKINRIEAAADPLIERMKAEGERSPADVFITVDAGKIEAARALGLLQPYASKRLSEVIPAHLRDPENNWFGFSVRARVFAINPDKIKAETVSSYEALANPEIKGKLLIRSSTNIYNQSLTGSMLAAHGPEKTEIWCKALVANFARPPRGGDSDQIRACAAGEGDVAVTNTYYAAGLARSSKPEDRAVMEKLKIIFPNQGDRGTHVNISGAAIAKHAKNVSAARDYLDYLSSPEAQKLFAEGNAEYPVVAGVPVTPVLAAFGSFKQDQLNARTFAANNASALQIMDRAGWK